MCRSPAAPRCKIRSPCRTSPETFAVAGAVTGARSRPTTHRATHPRTACLPLKERTLAGTFGFAAQTAKPMLPLTPYGRRLPRRCRALTPDAPKKVTFQTLRDASHPCFLGYTSCSRASGVAVILPPLLTERGLTAFAMTISVALSRCANFSCSSPSHGR